MPSPPMTASLVVDPMTEPYSPAGTNLLAQTSLTQSSSLSQLISGRSLAPTCSICSDCSASRRLRKLGLPASNSSTSSRVKVPSWISPGILRISSRVDSLISRGPRVYPPYSAVSDTDQYILEMPPSYIRSTISFISWRHSKYAASGWYPASTRVANPALISSETPPQSTACSPNRSVSVSSLNVVFSTPARVPPMPLAYDSASASALPDASCSTATSIGTPRPSLNWRRTRWPGALGATMHTSTSDGGWIRSYRMFRPCAKNSASPSTREGAIASAYTARCRWSGISTITRSDSSHASAGVSTRSPSLSARSRLFDPAGRPTRTSTPESRSDSACACPWLP